MNDVLDAAGTQARIVKSRLHGHNDAFFQCGVRGRAQARWFVDLEAEAVAGAVKKSGRSGRTV